MKRRNRISKYHIDNNGQIVNNGPKHISKRTQDLLGFSVLAHMMSGGYDIMGIDVPSHDENTDANVDNVEDLSSN
jgi:hypothetical protein